MEGVYERDGGFENWLRRGGLQTQDGYSVGSSAKWVVSSEEVIRGGYSRRLFQERLSSSCIRVLRETMTCCKWPGGGDQSGASLVFCDTARDTALGLGSVGDPCGVHVGPRPGCRRISREISRFATISACQGALSSSTAIEATADDSRPASRRRRRCRHSRARHACWK